MYRFIHFWKKEGVALLCVEGEVRGADYPNGPHPCGCWSCLVRAGLVPRQWSAPLWVLGCGKCSISPGVVKVFVGGWDLPILIGAVWFAVS